MEMVTVKRNGVFISFPELTIKNGNVRDDVIDGTRVATKSINVKPVKKTQQKNNKASRMVNPRVVKNGPSIIQQRARSILKIKVGKKCMRCGEECWRSDVSYCWDCYKYEHFESK